MCVQVHAMQDTIKFMIAPDESTLKLKETLTDVDDSHRCWFTLEEAQRSLHVVGLCFHVQSVTVT